MFFDNPKLFDQIIRPIKASNKHARMTIIWQSQSSWISKSYKIVIDTSPTDF